MAAVDEKIAAEVKGANTAQRLGEAASLEFNTYCAAFDWARAEEARVRVIAHLEAYLDHLTATYRAIEGKK